MAGISLKLGGRFSHEKVTSENPGIVIRYNAAAPNGALPHYKGTVESNLPFKPGTLRDSIYQAFSKDNSYKDVSVYHVSWNATKAPYGAMVEVGTSRAPAQSFIARAVAETRAQVRDAIKRRYVEEVTKA